MHRASLDIHTNISSTEVDVPECFLSVACGAGDGVATKECERPVSVFYIRLCHICDWKHRCAMQGIIHAKPSSPIHIISITACSRASGHGIKLRLIKKIRSPNAHQKASNLGRSQFLLMLLHGKLHRYNDPCEVVNNVTGVCFTVTQGTHQPKRP